MSPRQFYAANILSAIIWAPAHVFPGVLLAAAMRLAGASAEQLAILIIVGLIVALVVLWARRIYLSRGTPPARRPGSSNL
jgi:membrane protein DedA with SNARE-associated domain